MNDLNTTIHRTAVVVPAYRCKAQIFSVLQAIPKTITAVYVVDDCCPEQTGDFVRQNCTDARIRVLKTLSNLGVGGAVCLGYVEALKEEMDIIVKIDGDGQMNPLIIDKFVNPISRGQADYTKGNRFYDFYRLEQMPLIRIFGNAGLSFLSKISSGYWDIFDPTNGYCAVHARVLRLLPLEKLSQRYFFESDMLFRLNTVRARVLDIPMNSVYQDEKSHLKISVVFFEFLLKHFRNFFKRVIYCYYLRDFNFASLSLLLGLPLVLFGTVFGIRSWIFGSMTQLISSPGTVMLAALPIILGFQLLLNFVATDMASVPRESLHPLL
jgi:hypothetical protein